MGNFRRLLSYLGHYKPWVFAAIISNILTAIFTVVSIPLLIPFFEILFDQAEIVTQAPESIRGADDLQQWLSYTFSQYIETFGKEAALGYVCIAILTTFLLKNLFRYLALFFMAPARNGIIRDLRTQLYSQLLSLPLGYFTEERKGDLMARITSDTQEVESSILNVLEAIFREPFIIAGALGFMIYISPSLTGFVFLLLIFTGVVIGGIGRRLKRASAGVQARLGDIVSHTEETLGGLRIIKAFGAEDYQSERFATINNDHRRRLTRLLWRRDLSSPLTEFLGIATVALLLWYGSRQVFSGTMEAGTFIAFIFAFYNVIDPAKNFSKAYYNVQRGLGALDRVAQLLDLDRHLPEVDSPAQVESLNQGITFDNVSFQYGPGQPQALAEIDLFIPKGKSVALVGASGAGKSTMADLLARFYDPLEGSVCLDGTDLRKYKLKDIRRAMGIVSQEAILFNDSVVANIAFGRPVDRERIEQAARIANAHEFVSQMERGYETNIGDRGSKLSGGQKQRLTIARAVYHDPEILILDEATSALDSESERLVQDALNKLMTGRTALIIAHRLSTIQQADEIVVMEQGRIVERGTHLELLEIGGHYAKLVELQEL
ncbi:MAG: ABC transporter ATP-binding protein [Bacteroidota bacterium]